MIHPAASEVPFDPESHLQDPVGDLTLVIRRLRLGTGRVRLPGGTLVVSRAVQRGRRGQRKFTVVPPNMTHSLDRHRLMASGSGDMDAAEVAARKALELDKKEIEDADD